MEAAVVLGLLQGTLEWLPVSSQGVTVAVYSLVFDGDIPEGIGYSLWLHAGTVPSVLVAFRKEVAHITSDLFTRPIRPSPLAAFLVVSTLVSGVVGMPLVLLLTELSGRAGSAAMVIVGVALLFTGALQIARRERGARTRDELAVSDGLLAGVAQGLAIVPGLSRSGVTVAALLWRRVDRREALVISFLMSVPASLAAATFAAVSGDFTVSPETVVAAAVAFCTGLVTINVLVAVAARVNFAAFVLVVGAAIIAGAVWQTLG